MKHSTMVRRVVLLDTSPPLPPSSSSSSSLIVMIIVLSSALILSICLYILLRCLSRHPPSSSTTTTTAAATPPSLNSTVSLPLFKFNSLTTNTTETADCAICLASFDPTDQLRLLPLCCHAFHAPCIDKWLSSQHDTCPLCRSTVYPSKADILDKTLPSLTRGNSYRVEIGSLSQRRAPELEESFSRSYSIGALEYIVGDRYKEVVVDVTREGLSGGDVVGRGWLMDYVDRLGSYSRTFSRRGSGNWLWNSSVRRGEVAVQDLEAYRAGEEISEYFRWISGV